MNPVAPTSDITLSSPFISVGIDAQRGANMCSIITPHEPEGWLFYDPDKAAATRDTDLSYDEVWRGGFEELFPNDAAGTFEGRQLRDHGELWDAPFSVLHRDATSAQLKRTCVTVPAIVRKTVQLHSAGSRLDLTYQIEHIGTAPFDFLFKLHPAMRLEPGDRLLLPGGRVTRVDPSFSAIAGKDGRWPCVPSAQGGMADLSLVPDRNAGLKEFIYVSDLPEGWCGVRRSRTGEEIVFRYPLEQLPYCWLFMTYGGWRGYYTVVLEPCTNIPKDLAAAKAGGTCARLQPGEMWDLAVTVTIRGRDDR